jgi:hypothetical protein
MKLEGLPGEWEVAHATVEGRCAVSGDFILPCDPVYVTNHPNFLHWRVLVTGHNHYLVEVAEAARGRAGVGRVPEIGGE